MILVTHFACCHQYKGYWRSCPLGWSYFTVMPGLNLRAGGAHAPEFTNLTIITFDELHQKICDLMSVFKEDSPRPVDSLMDEFSIIDEDYPI